MKSFRIFRIQPFVLFYCLFNYLLYILLLCVNLLVDVRQTHQPGGFKLWQEEIRAQRTK